MANEIADFKNIVRSVLLTNPEDSTVEDLKVLYEELIFEKLPLDKYG